MQDDAQTQRWLAALRDGTPAQKADARRNLAALFEARGLLAEATDLLVTNAREGHRDAATFRALARLYRAQGDEYNAAAAALEAARLGGGPPADRPPPQSGPPGPHSQQRTTTPPPFGGGQPGPSRPPRREPTGPSRRGPGRQDPFLDPGAPPASGARRSRSGGGPAPRVTRSLGGSSRTVGYRIIGGIVAFAALMAGVVLFPQQPVTSLLYAISALLLALAVAGHHGDGIRRLLHVPQGPLGTGMLIFGWLLVFLAGGALIPRPEASDPAAPRPSPAPFSTRTPIPDRSGQPATPTRPSPRQQQPVTPRPSATPRGQSAPPAATVAPTPPPPEATPAAQTPAAEPSGGGTRMIVVNAAPDGVRLRPTPGDGDPLKILADGSQVTALSDIRAVAGTDWRLVRDESGAEGWIAAEFLAAVLSVTPTTLALAATPLLAGATSEPPNQPPPATPPPQPVTPTSPPATRPPVPTGPVAPTPAEIAATPTRAAAPATPAPAPPTATAALAASKPQASSGATSSGSSGAGRIAPQGMACPSSHPLKGNHSSSGEWIYHPPGGQFYSRTRPEACFASAADASAAGYRASQR